METQKIEIPAKYKVYAIRVNRGNGANTGARGLYEWPEHGKAHTTDTTGLYGVMLSQDLYHIWQWSNFGIYQKYMILEVDTRKIHSMAKASNTEIKFNECNVLFSGQLPEFMEQLKQYATEEQLTKINDLLSWKVEHVKAERTKRLNQLNHI